MALALSFGAPAEAARGKGRAAGKQAAKQATKGSGKKATAAAATRHGAKSRAARIAAASAAASALAAPRALARSSQPLDSEDDAAPADARDRAFFDARRAYASGDVASLDTAARTLNEHPLADYPLYWRLAIGLRGAYPSAATEAGIEQFFRNSRNAYLVEELREDLIKSLARRERWDDIVVQAGLLRGRDDRAVQCHIWQAELMRGASLRPETRELLLSPRELGEGCNALLQSADARGQLSRDEMLQRLRLSAEAGAFATGRRAAALLAIDSADLAHAMRAPSYILKRGSRETEALVMALATTARNDADDAAAAAQNIRLPAEAQAFVWAVIGAQGAQKLSAQSIDWVRKGVDARVSDDTRGWMARAALASADWKLVRELILKMSPAGQSDPVWVYWLARAQRELQQPEQSLALLNSIAGQWSFYGHLAAEELGQRIAAPPEPRALSEDETAKARNHPGLTRALKLYALGLRADGNREWNFALREMSDRELIAAADFACKLSILDRCVNTADRTRHEHKLSLRFLAPFRERLAQFAQEHKLDPAWVYGLIRQESRFQQQARSHVGAQGLMQIMPKTGSWIARQLGHSGYSVSDLHDLDTNLRFGTYYLRDVANRLEQSEVMASAAYNAGPGRPARWRQALAGVTDGALFAEIIPFNETRDYVKKVLWNATWYATLFSGQPQSLKARLGQISPRSARLTKRDESSPPPELDAAPTAQREAPPSQDTSSVSMADLASGER